MLWAGPILLLQQQLWSPEVEEGREVVPLLQHHCTILAVSGYILKTTRSWSCAKRDRNTEVVCGSLGVVSMTVPLRNSQLLDVLFFLYSQFHQDRLCLLLKRIQTALLL